MNEKQFREYFERYIDGELEDNLKDEMENYIKSNPLAELLVDDAKKMDSLIRNHSQREEAPYELKESIVQKLDQQGRLPFSIDLSWLSGSLKPALAGALVVILTFGVFVKISEPFPLFAESVNRHMQFLKGEYPLEIASNDINEVKEWFEGKMNFAVKVPIVEDDVSLLGGRICHIKDRKVAYFIFEKDGHKISAFIIDAQDMKLPQSEKIDEGEHIHYVKNFQGYRSVFCIGKKMRSTGCVFVSDLPEKELMGLIL